MGISRRLSEEFSFALAVVLTPVVIAKEGYRLFEAQAEMPASHAVGFLNLLGSSLVGMGLSFLAGLAALYAPGGLGWREAVLVVLLRGRLGTAGPRTPAAVSRAIALVADVAVGVVGMALLRGTPVEGKERLAVAPGNSETIEFYTPSAAGSSRAMRSTEKRRQTHR